MPDVVGKANVIWRRFKMKRLFWYLLPNVFFNTTIPYFTFRNLGTIHLFQGEYCFARFLLPMALFLPFILTIDILKRTVALTEQGKVGFTLPDQYTKHKFMFKMAGVNAIVSLLLALLSMASVQLFLPDGYGFDGLSLTIVLGLFAATLTIVFTLWPIKRLMELQAG